LTDLDESLGSGLLDHSEFWAETVLNNLPEGNHTLKAYSTDAYGEHMYASVDFVIDTSYTSPDLIDSSSPSLTPTPTPYNEPQTTEQVAIIGVAIIVAVIAAGLDLLVYLIKRK
jgi:hypothetical protein